MEKTNKQWPQHFKCFLCFLSTVVLTLLRGSRSIKSLVGIERCSGEDWTVLILFLVANSCILYSGLRAVT